MKLEAGLGKSLIKCAEFSVERRFWAFNPATLSVQKNAMKMIFFTVL
jgi:hypothetical protein